MVKKPNIKRLIKSIRGKRARSKKTIENVEVEATVDQAPLPEVKIEEDEIKPGDEPKEIPSQIDETSQSSSRSESSRKSKRNMVKKQKSIEATVAEAIPNDGVMEAKPTEEVKVVEPIEHKHETVAPDIPTDEPIDLSQSKTKLSVPVVQEPVKTPPMKRRTRKLNDCIAMLTGKLQEKLGVPFISNETNILLSPSKSDSVGVAEIVKVEQQKQDGDEKNVQISSTEPGSSHSTPTKRGSRSPKTTEQKSKVVAPVIDDKPSSTPIVVNFVDAPTVVSSVAENEPTVIETSTATPEDDVTVSMEEVNVTTPIILPTISEPELTQVKRTPRRSTSTVDIVDDTTSKKLDETSRVTKRQEKSKATKTAAEPETIKIDSSLSEIVAIDTTATEATNDVELKEEENKNLQEATITADVEEPPVLEDASVDRVSKKRQTKNSSPKSIVSVKDDKPAATIASDSVEKPEPIAEHTVQVTNKQKPAKAKAGKNNTKNSPSVSSSPRDTEPLKNSVTQENVDKPIKDEKDVKKGRKSKKSSVVSETKLPEVKSPSKPNAKTKESDLSEDEMHPWDPEIGFITANNPEPAATPPALVPDGNEKIRDASSSGGDPNNEIIPPSTTKKKRRKNELAKIIADQLLESFKEVDKSRIEELKLLHDLSIESNDDLLLSTTMSRTPPPKRRTASNIRNDVVAESNSNVEEVNSSENVDKGVLKRKKAGDTKKPPPSAKIGKKRKNVTLKANKKDNRKKVADVPSSGYLSDTEISQPKKPIIMRRRLTICDESPKRMSRNSKETEVPISLFDSFKKRKNAGEISTKTAPKDAKVKPQSKLVKRRNKRSLLHQLSDDLTKNPPNDEEPIAVEKAPLNSDKCEDNEKSKANVNDLVTQIINDFTTSTLNSPTTSPILFGDVAKPRLNNTATKLSSVLNNKKNILNGETLANGFKSDVSKEITFATLSQPLKDKTVEQLRNTDSSASDAKQPFRPPFMSPRWDPSDEWNGTTKPIKDPALHKLWTLNNKDEQLSGDKSLYQSVKEKTKKLLGKISRKKSRKHDGTLNNKKSTVTVSATKRPLLRPSILSVSNHTAKVDAVDTENCLKTLETNSLFLGKLSNFENDANSKIFRNDKANSTTGDKVESSEIVAEDFSKKSDTVINNLKSNFEKDDWKTEKKFDENVSKSRSGKNDRKLPVEAVDTNRLSKQNAKKKPQSTDPENEPKNVPKKDNVDKAMAGSAIQRRKMGSTKRRPHISVNKAPEDPKKPLASKTKSSMESTAVKPIGKGNAAKSFDESSQDKTSKTVSNVHDTNDDHVTESDEDLSLAEIAKNLNNKTGNEFSNVGDAEPVELSESFVGKSNFSTLVAVINDQLESKHDEKGESEAECEEDGEDGEFINDTNTDLIDMDLEDTASIYTSSTVTTSGGSPKKRKRRHGRSILMKSSRKTKRGDGSFLTPGESFFCDLCSKTFRTQGGLATHRTTLTHISKLSEQEFKQKMETPKESSPEPKPVAEEDVTTKPDVTTSPVIESSSQPQIPFSQSPLSNQRHVSITSPVRNQSLTYLNNIEPISSPEQHDFNYDRYNTNSRPRSSVPSHDTSRIALSQEQRFFYECCSMLKGSDRSNVNPSESPSKYYTLPERTDVITKPVTPRSNEQYSYVVPEGSKHSKGIPKIDLNQFSDISSDSNPAFSCPQNPSSSETQNIFPMESKRIDEKRDYHSPERNFDAMKKDARTFSERTTILDAEYHETYSDMGDSFPSSQDVSESEQYTQTILERSSNSDGLIRGGYHESSSTVYGKNCDDNKKRRNVFTIAMDSNETKGHSNSSPVESPLHSTSSQSSTLSKPRTKAAMKGYDNFKISIPTTGIDLQQALTRSPNASGCKLAALADIALGNDVPSVVALIRSHSDVDIEPSHTPIEHPSEEPVPEVISQKQTVPKKTNKFGASNRKKKVVSAKTSKKPAKTNVRTSPKATPKSQPKDVYDFEDFDDLTDAPILTLSQVRSKPVPPLNVEEDDSETSSYSDRLDFNYESMSESDTSVDNLQKKCLIERIFKSVKKPDAKEKEKIEPKKPIPKQELDKLFDGLRQSDKNAKVDEKKVTEKSTNVDASKQVEGKVRNERSRDRQSKKSREIANLEEEWGMSMNQIAELIGVGQRKTQRRCAANKQKTFAENWSSDEYEDFHATKDIFALIREAEMKAGRARSRTARSNAKRERQQQNDKIEPTDDAASNVKSKTGADSRADAKDKENKAATDDKNDESAGDKAEDINSKVSEPTRRSHSKSTDSKTSAKKPAKVFTASKGQKIKNRRQTISSRPDLHKTPVKGMSNGARVKPHRSADQRDIKSDGRTKTKPMSRRKRKASDMLYYWSSSSDEDFGRIKPRDDNFDDDNLEQHGWIVGDSHKKLVTLLAHAKGKKIEDCAVKKAIHKKKS
ncbi:hypothetical protein HA402_013057 [Bradysia odoriphaga]|nr:hypothetical protein HA402_013057 [Bradysia odoriphaga]